MFQTNELAGQSPQRPRVAVVTPSVNSSLGTEGRLVEWLTRLQPTFDFHLYSTRVSDVDLSRITWHRIPSLPGPHLLRYLWWFTANHLWRWWDRRVRGLKYDLVYSPGVNCLDADAVTVHVVFAELRRQASDGLRLVGKSPRLWPRLLHRRLYYRLIQALERRVFVNPRVMLAAISRKTAEDVARLFRNGSRPAVIYHGLDLERFSPQKRLALRERARATLALPADALALLLIGNDWKNKGLLVLLDAVGQLGDARLHVLAVGSDDPALCRSRIERYGLGGRVHFLSRRADVEFYYAAADAYVAPSLEDAFALPPAEAMACGLPVIVSSHAGASEVITDGADGLILLDPRDPAELAALIRRLLEDDGLRQRLGQAAARTASHYTWERNAAEMCTLFARAMNGRGRA